VDLEDGIEVFGDHILEYLVKEEDGENASVKFTNVELIPAANVTKDIFIF